MSSECVKSFYKLYCVFFKADICSKNSQISLLTVKIPSTDLKTFNNNKSGKADVTERQLKVTTETRENTHK